MIIDSLSEAAKYYSLNPLFETAFQFLIDNYDTLVEGRYPLEDGRVVISVEDAAMRSRKEAVLEAHDKHIDIQLPLSSNESYGWRYRGECYDAKGAIDKKRDVIFFDDEPQDFFTVEPGQFVILFPSDAHAPLVGTASSIKKCVVKIELR